MCFWLAQGGLVLAINILSLLRYLGDTGVWCDLELGARFWGRACVRV
jgi:hypothetical protein